MRFDPELRELLESGVSIAVGTAHPRRGPEVTRGWGLRVLDDDAFHVFVDEEPGAETLDNLRANRRIAVTVALPTTSRSVQLKGRCTEIAAPTADDLDWVQQHRDAFASTAALLGIPPALIRRLGTTRLARLNVAPERAFEQTPGPGAGAPL